MSVTSPSAELAQADTVKPLPTTTVSVSAVTTATDATTLSNANVQQMLLNYEDLSKKQLQFVHIPTLQTTAQLTLVQPTTSPNIVPSHSSTQSNATSHHT